MTRVLFLKNPLDFLEEVATVIENANALLNQLIVDFKRENIILKKST